MRLKLEFSCDNLKLPMNYQSQLQGLIYSTLNEEEYGRFMHDQGYSVENKTFKMFVFSNLFGKYSVDTENHTFTFKDTIYFYIASQVEEFIQHVYEFFLTNEYVMLNHQKIKIKEMKFIEVPYFRGEKDIVIHTISPVVTYKTVDKYVTYFKPSDEEFESICLTNLREKNKAIHEPIDEIVFSIQEVVKERKRLVKFKNTFYISYLTDLKIHTNFQTLNLLYNTGLSAKGSAGFGMIETRL